MRFRQCLPYMTVVVMSLLQILNVSLDFDPVMLLSPRDRAIQNNTVGRIIIKSLASMWASTKSNPESCQNNVDMNNSLVSTRYVHMRPNTPLLLTLKIIKKHVGAWNRFMNIWIHSSAAGFNSTLSRLMQMTKSCCSTWFLIILLDSNEFCGLF